LGGCTDRRDRATRDPSLVQSFLAVTIGLPEPVVIESGQKPSRLGLRAWEIHTMIAVALLLIVGSQVVGVGLAARAYGVYFLSEKDRLFGSLRARLRLEHGLLVGAVLILLGMIFGRAIVFRGPNEVSASFPRPSSRSSRHR
jgi:hypothetical protein